MEEPLAREAARAEKRGTIIVPTLVKIGGVAAILSSLLGIALGPAITTAYSLAGRIDAPPWEPALSNVLGPLFSFAAPKFVYEAYGRLYLAVFAGFLLGLLALRARGYVPSRPLGRWGYWLSVAGLFLSLGGNLGDYWLMGKVVGDWSFVLGTLLGLIMLYVGSGMLGVAVIRTSGGPRTFAWLLALAVPGTVLASLAGFGNVPSGEVLWFCLAFLSLGLHVLSPAMADGTTARKTQRTTGLR